ncbi:MAG: hypothetical protein HDS55_05480 [Barnesiella sp.]|nr:hypothetical protein [Barnesiella sp.]MBD5246189.1 hypothetical protein [Barnesiella sp.]
MRLNGNKIKKIISDLVMYVGALLILIYGVMVLPQASLPIGFFMGVLGIFFLYYLYLVTNHILLVVLKVYSLKYIIFCEALMLFVLMVEIVGVLILLGTPVK